MALEQPLTKTCLRIPDRIYLKVVAWADEHDVSINTAICELLDECTEEDE